MIKSNNLSFKCATGLHNQVRKIKGFGVCGKNLIPF